MPTQGASITVAGGLDLVSSSHALFRTPGAATILENFESSTTGGYRRVSGYSKFGGYEGNGNADGAFVYTGFRPAYVMTKSIDSTSAWHIFDSKREGYNADNDALEADAATVEATADQIDLLSNGFKAINSEGSTNTDGGTYLFYAIAEIAQKHSTSGH